MGAREQLRQNSVLELGRHIVADIRVENKEILTDINFFKKLLYQSAIKANLKVIGESHYKFDKTGGFSFMLFIAESHIFLFIHGLKTVMQHWIFLHAEKMLNLGKLLTLLFNI